MDNMEKYLVINESNRVFRDIISTVERKIKLSLVSCINCKFFDKKNDYCLNKSVNDLYHNELADAYPEFNVTGLSDSEYLKVIKNEFGMFSVLPYNTCRYFIKG